MDVLKLDTKQLYQKQDAKYNAVVYNLDVWENVKCSKSWRVRVLLFHLKNKSDLSLQHAKCNKFGLWCQNCTGKLLFQDIILKTLVIMTIYLTNPLTSIIKVC